ncbi:MAG: hypothetical protein FJX74_19190 [Armatimonadetes bacterium]|nr:hypothetical protein [Armatimonadota bacterium]
MARRHGQKMGCCELVAVVFGLFVALQFAVLGARVVTELAVFAGTLVKWIGLGLAGALTMAAFAAVIYGLGRGLSKAAEGLSGSARPVETAPAREESYHRRARRWQRGINTTVGRLRRRRWVQRDEAKRYRESVSSAVTRIRSLESDVRTLRSLPASGELADQLEAMAQTLLARLERTHHALAKLLAESALERAPLIDAKLRDATDEVEALVTALADVSASSPASAEEEERRAIESLETTVERG